MEDAGASCSAWSTWPSYLSTPGRWRSWSARAPSRSRCWAGPVTRSRRDHHRGDHGRGRRHSAARVAAAHSPPGGHRRRRRGGLDRHSDQEVPVGSICSPAPATATIDLSERATVRGVSSHIFPTIRAAGWGCICCPGGGDAGFVVVYVTGMCSPMIVDRNRVLDEVDVHDLREWSRSLTPIRSPFAGP